MTSGLVHPKIAVNEAVELAKEFSTDRSPSFVNALLDKVLRKVLARRQEPPGASPDVQVRTTLSPAADEPRGAAE
jgi:hypothetical protein